MCQTLSKTQTDLRTDKETNGQTPEIEFGASVGNIFMIFPRTN